MLVLSRRPGQEIVIGDSIRVAVTRVHGNYVSLGIEAPKDVRISRPDAKDKGPNNEPVHEPGT